MQSLPAAELFDRLVRVEQELAELRRGLLKLLGVDLARKSSGSLRGIWQGVILDEEDFAEAKTSLFPEKDI